MAEAERHDSLQTGAAIGGDTAAAIMTPILAPLHHVAAAAPAAASAPLHLTAAMTVARVGRNAMPRPPNPSQAAAMASAAAVPATDPVTCPLATTATAARPVESPHTPSSATAPAKAAVAAATARSGSMAASHRMAGMSGSSVDPPSCRLAISSADPPPFPLPPPPAPAAAPSAAAAAAASPPPQSSAQLDCREEKSGAPEEGGAVGTGHDDAREAAFARQVRLAGERNTGRGMGVGQRRLRR